MISYIFTAVVYKPLYNGLIFLLSFIPHGDVGAAIILFTIIIKLVLFPLSHRSIRVQKQMKQLEPELQKIKEKYKDDKNEQAKQTMALYQEKDLNPLAGIFALFIQIPILIGLYQIFRGTGLPHIDPTLLYSFVHAPMQVTMQFLGFLDVSTKSIVLAVLAGATQYLQVSYSLPPTPARTSAEPGSFSDELGRAMNTQSRYILPVFTFLIAWSVSGAISLYLITSNLFAIGQELYVRRSLAIETAQLAANGNKKN